jgi:hypothetical protein
MQPPWREGELLSRDVPADVDWEPILRGGSNGLALIVMALSWWIHSSNAGSGVDEELHGAISDVHWVLSQIVGFLAIPPGSKRPHGSDDEDQPKSKR